MSFIMPFFSKRIYKFRLPQVLTLGLVLVCMHSQAALAADYFGIGSAVELVFKGLLYGVFIFMSWLASFGSVAMETVLKPEFVGALFQMKALETSWKIVRDFANIGFIFILLFSAFATIFQVAQYHIKKIFLSVLLAALFINLSFPIARFIIDTTTVPMYFFLNQIQGSASATNKQGTVTGEFITSSGLQEILFPKGEVASSQSITNKSTTYIITAIVFMFLFAVTILVLAFQFFLRWVGLFILLIFSPLGFIGGVFPGLGSFSSKWWDKFISYCLFGPAAALLLLIATKLMREFGEPGGTFVKQALQTANNVKGDEAPFFAAIIPFVFCLALLWIAIGVGSSFGIAGADAISSKGKAFAKGVAKDRRNPFYGMWYNAAKTWNKKRGDARTQAEQRGLAYRMGSNLSYRQDQAIAGVAGTVGGVLGNSRAGLLARNLIGADAATQASAENRNDSYNKGKVEDAAKLYRVANMEQKEMETIRDDKSSDKYLKAAVLQRFANEKELDMSVGSNIAAMDSLAKNFGATSTVFKGVNDKLRAYDPVAAMETLFRAKKLTNRADPEVARARREMYADYVKSSDFDPAKINKNSVQSKEFLSVVLENGKVERDQLEKWAKDDTQNKANIIASLEQESGYMLDHTKKADRIVQESLFSMSGGMNAAGVEMGVMANSDWQKQIFSQLSKDFGTKINQRIADNYLQQIVENINPGNYKEFILNGKDGVGKYINDQARAYVHPTNKNAQTVNRRANTDPALATL